MLTVLPYRAAKPLATAVATAVLSIGLVGCLSSGSSSSTNPPVAGGPTQGEQGPGAGTDNGTGGGAGSDPGAGTTPVDPRIASTTQGDVRGIELEDDVLAFRGIRYGAAPIGELRFAAPQTGPAWEGMLELTEAFGSSCPQEASAFGEASVNEDCLYLNVYRPTAAGDYPVMVWIHGGAFVFGSGGPAYNPSRLVKEGVVVVTLNYRLGALGFLPHEALGDANFGLQDQQLALRWVRDNIAAFDGDPENVTIFGESAGGHSVLSQLASPGAAGLFHKAIVQSGSYNGDQIPFALGQAVFGETTIRQTPCDGDAGEELVSCLRALSVEELLEAQPGNILPTTGTTVLPLSINAALQSEDDFNQVPVMMGSNRDEGSLFALLALVEDNFAFGNVVNYRNSVASLLEENPMLDARAVADHYDSMIPSALTGPARYFAAYAAIGTDWRFNCPNNKQWTLLADKVDTYGYWFTDRGAPTPASLGTSPFTLGASHSFEIQYVLNSLTGMQSRGASEASLDLARKMTTYWANFAKYGDNRDIGPNDTSNAAGSITWPRYVDNGNIMNLGTPSPAVVPVTEYRTTHQCAFWDNPPTISPQ